jgi:hypothetical protein
LFTISRGNAGAFLATVLEGKECEKGKTGYIFVVGIDTKDSARLVQDYSAPNLILNDSANLIIALFTSEGNLSG